MNYKALNTYTEHPLKKQLQYNRLAQFDVARSIGISQSALSRQLAGVAPMPQRIQEEIENILNRLKSKKPKPKVIH